jgi:hypothetical protein
MPILPADVLARLTCFAPLFSARVWRHVPPLVIGALLAPGERTITAVLRVMGLGQLATFQTYHRVLSRAVWSSRHASRILFGLLLAAFAPTGPVLVGIDETLERRRGKKIGAAGIYRDPVRSSHSHFVKVRGLRWICAMLLVPIPWAGRTWALPVLTVLAPSEREAARKARRYKPLTAWARQLIRQLHRWVPHRSLVVVGDRTYAALELLARRRPPHRDGCGATASGCASICPAAPAPAAMQGTPAARGRAPAKSVVSPRRSNGRLVCAHYPTVVRRA